MNNEQSVTTATTNWQKKLWKVKKILEQVQWKLHTLYADPSLTIENTLKPKETGVTQMVIILWGQDRRLNNFNFPAKLGRC